MKRGTFGRAWRAVRERCSGIHRTNTSSTSNTIDYGRRYGVDVSYLLDTVPETSRTAGTSRDTMSFAPAIGYHPAAASRENARITVPPSKGEWPSRRYPLGQ